MDTLGSVIDKLVTIDMKMWNNQELLFDIRRMTFEEFKSRYFGNVDTVYELWETLGKVVDLNLQRSNLIDEFDIGLVEMIEKSTRGESLDDGTYIQRKHKTF